MMDEPETVAFHARIREATLARAWSERPATPLSQASDFDGMPPLEPLRDDGDDGDDGDDDADMDDASGTTTTEADGDAVYEDVDGDAPMADASADSWKCSLTEARTGADVYEKLAEEMYGDSHNLRMLCDCASPTATANRLRSAMTRLSPLTMTTTRFRRLCDMGFLPAVRAVLRRTLEFAPPGKLAPRIRHLTSTLQVLCLAHPHLRARIVGARIHVALAETVVGLGADVAAIDSATRLLATVLSEAHFVACLECHRAGATRGALASLRPDASRPAVVSLLRELLRSRNAARFVLRCPVRARHAVAQLAEEWTGGGGMRARDAASTALEALFDADLVRATAAADVRTIADVVRRTVSCPTQMTRSLAVMRSTLASGETDYEDQPTGRSTPTCAETRSAARRWLAAYGPETGNLISTVLLSTRVPGAHATGTDVMRVLSEEGAFSEGVDGDHAASALDAGLRVLIADGQTERAARVADALAQVAFASGTDVSLLFDLGPTLHRLYRLMHADGAPPRAVLHVRVAATAADGDCPVCLQSLATGDDAARTACGHVMHGACLRRWHEHGSATCPMCRKSGDEMVRGLLPPPRMRPRTVWHGTHSRMEGDADGDAGGVSNEDLRAIQGHLHRIRGTF